MITLERVEWPLIVGTAIAVAALFTSLPSASSGCRQRTGEARAGLKRLSVAEEAFRADHGGYGADVNAIGFSVDDGGVYRYVVTDAYADRFVGWAFRADGIDDVWRINEQSTLQHVVDRCW